MPGGRALHVLEGVLQPAGLDIVEAGEQRGYVVSSKVGDGEA